MSDGYYPKNDQTQFQSLKVQELVISGSDPDMYVSTGGNTFVNIREKVEQIYLVQMKVDSSNLVTQYQQSSLSIVDFAAHTAGGDRGAIKITGLASVATNDCLIVKYSVKNNA